MDFPKIQFLVFVVVIAFVVIFLSSTNLSFVCFFLLLFFLCHKIKREKLKSNQFKIRLNDFGDAGDEFCWKHLQIH